MSVKLLLAFALVLMVGTTVPWASYQLGRTTTQDAQLLMLCKDALERRASILTVLRGPTSPDAVPLRVVAFPTTVPRNLYGRDYAAEVARLEEELAWAEADVASDCLK